MAALLERNHYAVDAVYDGREALDYLAGGNYDALILDIMMPKNGWDGGAALPLSGGKLHPGADAHRQR